jgi:hypothetical protein
VLETYGGLKPLSDSVRSALYRSSNVYENDVRDLILYNQVRPKFFASEPASVTFCYSLFTFVWLVVSQWRLKFVLYGVLVAAGLFVMPGPTLLLLLLLVLPYLLFLVSRQHGRLNVRRFLQVAIVAMFCGGAALLLGPVLFKERFDDIRYGNDPSFFYRVEGPALAARTAIRLHPVAGAGLTGEPFIELPVLSAYSSSRSYSAHWGKAAAKSELLINYFWLHWIYLGVVFGLLMAVLLSSWLVTLGVPSVGFCWVVWAILGQASGAYVGPTCWAVMFLAGAAAILNQRPAPTHRRVRPVRMPVAGLPARLEQISYR